MADDMFAGLHSQKNLLLAGDLRVLAVAVAGPHCILRAFVYVAPLDSLERLYSRIQGKVDWLVNEPHLEGLLARVGKSSSEVDSPEEKSSDTVGFAGGEEKRSGSDTVVFRRESWSESPEEESTC
ncbi:NAD(P)-binding Rossmann-fold superfamily protein [Striga asiatica]|uniref:NAD(P)-binding Rossmann-fold superfamily protein n=1 Tax=Striga asiatica TaxID=4170 RepID=A0A5A7PRU8_STRAF|nr:NAD(P)-binding Rossmann-fold superfamily protein [Striga asiatica]